MTVNSFRRIAIAAVLALITTPLHADVIYGTNLIVNGDAESGTGATGDSVVPVLDWTTTSNFTVVQYGSEDLLPSSPGPVDRGLNYFYGGPNNAFSSATQGIDLSSAATQIDAGSVSYNLSGWLGGLTNQYDDAVLTATFLNASGGVLGTSSIGPVAAEERGDTTGLLYEEASGVLPSGTRTVSVELLMTRYYGSDNDGLADNLSFVVTPVPEPASLTILISALLGLGVVYLRRRRATA